MTTPRPLLRRVLPLTTGLVLLLALPGCTGDPSDDDDASMPSVTWHADIEPIVEAHCTPCHTPGGAGPFPLETWSQVEPLAQAVRDVVRARFMPPAPGSEVCSEPGARCTPLSDEQIALFEQWAAEGFAEGSPP